MKLLDWIARLKLLGWMGLVILLAAPGLVLAAPGSILFQDNFNRSNAATALLTNGVGNGWVVGGGGACTGDATAGYGCAGIDTDAKPWSSATLPLALRAHGAGSQSLFLRWSTVSVDQAVNLLGKPAASLSFWARRGSDCFSEMPGDPASDPGCSATATITVGGSGSTSVSGITVNGVQIMSAASTANASVNTVADNIRNRISLGGYTATVVGGNVVTITGPGTIAGFSPVITVASGTMTFAATPFVAVQAAAFTPIYGEEFLVQYLNSASAWVTLAQYPNDGTAGEEFAPTIDLPADALWSGFKLRFYQPSGSGGNTATGSGATGVYGRDYWHVDDVKIIEQAATSFTGSFCDTFEGDLSRWTMTGAGTAGIGSKYFQNGVHSLDIRWGAVSATTKPTDITGVSGPIVYWIKRGVTRAANTSPNLTGSDLPDAGENLVVEYLKTNGTWGYLVPANSFLGGGTSGQVYSSTGTPATNSVAIPADSNRAVFQMRFRLLAGTGYDMDYWHVDDLCVGSSIQSSDLSIAVTPASTNLAPGATTTLTATVTNNGPSAEPGPITITDTLAQGLVFDAASAGWTCTATTTTVTCTRTGSLAVNASASLTLTVHADPVASGSFSNTVTVGGQSSSDPQSGNNQASNSYTFVAAAFEAYETSTTPTSAITGRIFTKLAGTSFNLKVVAIDASAINTTYNKTVTVDLIDGAAACLAGTAALTGVTAPASYLYIAGDNGVHTFAFTVTKAYRDVRVRIKDNSGAIDCSSDNFAIRPNAFAVTSTDATNNSVSGAPTIKAGAAFNLTAASVVGYDGTPIVNNTTGMIIGTPNAGTISGAFAAAPVATGTAAGSGFSYSEVGNFGLALNAVYDATFTAVDQPPVSGAYQDCTANFSNVLVGGQYGCSIGSAAIAQTTGSSGFGRFIPDHFDTVIISASGVPMPCPVGLTCPAAGFVYSGQPFTVQVFARNLAGVTTANYAGAYAKTVTLSAWDALGSITTNNPSAGTLGVTTASAFVAGVSNNTAQFYTISSTTAPTNIFLRAAESAGDGVTSLRAIPANSIEAGFKVVSGRIKVSNAHGSELLVLPITVTVQYYNGTVWLTSTTDSATSLTLPATIGVTPAGTTTPSTVGGVTTVSAGLLNISLSKPTGGAGSAMVSPGAPGYLPLTAGLATFGVYKGNNEFIYLRENY